MKRLSRVSESLPPSEGRASKEEVVSVRAQGCWMEEEEGESGSQAPRQAQRPALQVFTHYVSPAQVVPGMVCVSG